MKKFVCVSVSIIIIAISIGLILGNIVLKSPEYALFQIAKDIKSDGINGLSPHLTEEARESLDIIISISENKYVSAVISIFDNSNNLNTLRSNFEKPNGS